MRYFHGLLISLALASGTLVSVGLGQSLNDQAWQLEKSGDALGARDLLQQAAQKPGASLEALESYAAFLDRHKDPQTRAAYEKVLASASAASRGPLRTATARRLAVLDLLAGDTAAATRHIAAYREAGGSGLEIPTAAPPPAPTKDGKPLIEVPGPMRSFSRMAALAPDLQPEDLLAALGRNVVTNGFQAANANESLEPTEYLKLVVRYMSQARELEKLAGDTKIITVPACDSTQTADILRVLGYRMRGGCGSEVVLETVNATRAFLTIDSGFPLASLEQALRANRPFTYDYHPALVPVLYGADYWLSSKDKQGGEFIDIFLNDPNLCRLYLGLSKLDPATAEELRKAMGIQKLKVYSHVLDFYGGMFQVRDGKAIVPGGARSEKMWSELVGVGPDKGAAFFEKLLARDDGWLASYFDALARINGATKDYLTEPARLKRFYEAVRGKVTSPGPARPVFRANTEMMLLTTRLRVEDGKPHLPGSVEVWKALFTNHPHGKYDAKLSKAAGNWKDVDDVLEALFGLCRKTVENEPLKIFMALSDVNRGRTKPLEPATIDRMAREFRIYGGQYAIFSETPGVSDKTIIELIDTAKAIDSIRDQSQKSDAAGMFQGLIAIWQILCRQGAIAAADQDAAMASIVSNFGKTKSHRELFDAGRNGIKTLLTTAHVQNGSPQERMLDLLAGSGSTDSEARTQVIQDMIRVLESQRLVSLDTLFDLADNLESVARGEKLNNALVAKLASRISEIQLPRSALSANEKNSLAFGFWTEKHIDAQRRINLRSAMERSGASAEKLGEIRGQLTPFLRDTLVGFIYAHYAPPGAQILHTNPLFVRSHDFVGIQGTPQTWKTTEVFGSGWPSNAGGRLVGSLANLPYAIAEAEQNFLIPTREQALIWGDLVPQMILSAKIPRWWSVTPAQLHWIGMHMSFAESLIAESALNPSVRTQVLAILDRYAPPVRVQKVSQLLTNGAVRSALDQIVPSEMFLLAAEMLRTPDGAQMPLGRDVVKLAAEFPALLNYRAIGRFFGTPKPTLANSYQPELLNLRTFPTLMGYSSRILAESWESNLLFYAALADEVHMSPAQLNVVIPEWTQQTVERIFATHLEDWPALLRSLRLVGDDVRQKMRKQMASDRAAGGQ